MKTIIKTKTLFLLACTLGFNLPISVYAQNAEPTSLLTHLKPGTYKGELQNGEEVYFFVKDLSAEGAQGSYLGLLAQFDDDNVLQLVAYRIEPVFQTLGLVPLGITSDGRAIGIKGRTLSGINPSLTLNLGPEENNKTSFTLTNSGTNTSGFQGPIYFDGKPASDLYWSSYRPGRYTHLENSDEVNFVLPLQRGDGTATVTRLLRTENTPDGTYEMDMPELDLFTLRLTVYSGSSVKQSEQPQSIGVFIKRTKGDFLLLINPKNSQDIEIFKRRK